MADTDLTKNFMWVDITELAATLNAMVCFYPITNSVVVITEDSELHFSGDVNKAGSDACIYRHTKTENFNKD